MKRTFKRILSCALCLLLLLSLLSVGALGVSADSNETNQVVITGYLISEGTLEFSSQEESSNGIYINFVASSDGTVTIDLVETDHDYCVVIYENDWWLTRFNGIDAPDTVEFSVKAGGQYNVIFSVVDYQTPTLDAWLPVAGFLTYRMISEVPVSDIVRWPHEDPRQILEDAYALEEGRYLPYGATLTGEITCIKTPYDSYYQNISVVMEVPGCAEMPILCYRLAGQGADTLTVGDTITVTGRISNYYGTIEFEQGCVLDGVVKGDNEVPVPPEDPRELVDTAYALVEGDNLPYIASLTGTIISIDTPYDSYYQNITVTIVVEGRETMPILCYRMKGQGADTLAVGDVITVSGILANYYGTVEFKQGCTLIEIGGPYAWGPDSLAIVGSGLPGIRAWDPADPAGDMTEVAPWFYQLTLECPANTLMHFKFAGNDMWDDAWNFGGTEVVLGQQVDLPCGPATADITLQVDEACTLLFTIDLSPMRYGENAMLLVNRVTPIAQPRPLRVIVPSSWEKVYAYTWEPESFGDYPGRELQKQDDYYWEAIRTDMENLVLTGLKKDGSYQCTDNISLLPGYDTVTVTVYDDGTYHIFYGEDPTLGGYDSISMVGSGLPGITEWDPMDTAGDMTEVAHHVYEKILNFTEPSTICFRIVANHDWFSGHAGGGDIVLGQPIALDSTAGSPDFRLDIPEACQLKFTVDLNTNQVDAPGTLLVEKVSTRKIKVKAPATWTGVDAYTWDPESLGVFPGTAMQKNGDVFELMVPADMVNLVLSGMLEDGTRQQYSDMHLEPGSNDLLIDISNAYPIVPDLTRRLIVFAPDSWLDVYAYTWDPEIFGYWPGTRMENDWDYYEMMIPQTMTNLVLSGSLQDGQRKNTSDIFLETNDSDVFITIIENNGAYRADVTYGPPVIGTYRVVGNANWMGMWDAASNKGLMEAIFSGIYRSTFENVQPGNYEFKITKNGKWDDAVGNPDGSNFVFLVPRSCKVTVTYVPETGVVDIALNGIVLQKGELTGNGKLNLGDVAKLYSHIRGNSRLTEIDELSNADFNGDGSINIGDTASLYAYIRSADETMIVDAAYRLEENQQMPTDSTLSGKVIEVLSPYDFDTGCTTVRMVVNGRENAPILCTRMTGTEAELVTIGDKITVTGRLRNFYGVVEFKEGCRLVKWEDFLTAKEAMARIVDAAYALSVNESMDHTETLTGEVISIEQSYNASLPYISVTIAVEGREDKPIFCYRMMGDLIPYVKLGDTVTVSGVLRNYQGMVEFTEGCQLDDRTWGTDNAITQPNGQQIEYAFTVPASLDSYQLTIKVENEIILDGMTIAPGVTSVTLPLVGNGTVVYDLYYNGVYFKSEMVEF